MIYTCDKCFKTFNKKSNYIYHLKRKIPCKTKIIINTDLDNKIKNETDEKTTSSSLEVVCETTPSSLVDITKNIEVNNKNDICNNEKNENSINFINSKNNGYKCLICNKIFKHSQSLTKHKKKNHNKNDDFSLNKNECDGEINTVGQKVTKIDKMKKIMDKK